MLGLTVYSWRDHPVDGWAIGENHVLPPNAYTDEVSWLKHVASMFPDIFKIINVVRKIGAVVILDYAVQKTINHLNKMEQGFKCNGANEVS